MRKTFLSILTIFLMLMLVACGSNNEATDDTTTSDPAPQATENLVFKIGAIPDQEVSELNRKFGQVASYLSEQTGLEVEYVPSVDYAALVTAFERGEIHLGWFGGLTGVQVRNLVPGAEAIAQRPRDAEFHSVFIAQKDLGLQGLEDIKGHSFTFGSESSTSGHLMPRFYLMEAGIDADQDFDGMPNYSGSHDQTYKFVESGAFQTGALNEAVWESAVKEAKLDTNIVDVFYTTPAYFDYNWTINTVDEMFGEGTKTKVTDALLSMNEEQKEILDLFQTDSFVETNNGNYSAIEDVAKQLGIIR